MIHFDFDGKPMLFYPDKRHVKDACQWFTDMDGQNPPSVTASVLRKVYGYEDLIICMGYTLFLSGIKPDKINFNTLKEEKIFINPFREN